MNHVHKSLIVVLFLVPIVAITAQAGGAYDLSWSVIAGGSGKLTGGTYTLCGSIGQPATAVSAGGTFAIASGFWTFATPIVADINGDGHVNVIDLLYLADAYGSASGDLRYPGASDLNQDGSVDTFDLLILATTFGKI